MTTYGSVDLQAIRQALRTQLLTTLEGKVNVYANDETPVRPPCIIFVPDTSVYFSYFESFGPNGRTDVGVVLLIEAGARSVDTQVKLDNLLSIGTELSIFDALMADPSLGNVVQVVHPQRALIAPGEDGYSAAMPLQIVVKKGGN